MKWCSTLQDMTEIPQTPANGINIQYVNSNSGYVPKRFEKNGLKKNKLIFLHSYSGKQLEGIQVSMDRQFHKQTAVYTQWNMIQPLKTGDSDNATMWMNLIIIMLSETNKTKKGQTFCDSTSMRKWNHLKASQIRRQKKQKVIPSC